MIRVAFTNLKGGTGKTTVTVMVARALAEAGVSVAVKDNDKQGTASEWLRQDGGGGVLPHAPGVKCDVLLIDTPPSEHGVNGVIGTTDAYVIVSSPSPADLWASKSAIGIIRGSVKKPTVKMLFNSVKKGGRLADGREELAKAAECDHLKAYITRRECYQHAAVWGWKALDRAARDEITKVSVELMSLLASVR